MQDTANRIGSAWRPVAPTLTPTLRARHCIVDFLHRSKPRRTTSRMAIIRLRIAITPIVLLLALWVGSAARADLRDDVSACSTIADEEQRLLCLDRIATRIDPNSSTSADVLYSGQWQIHSEISPIDDSKNVYLSVDGDRELRGFIGNHIPTLVIRCKEGNIDVFLDTGMTEAGDRTYVLIRLDGEPSFTEKWENSTNNEAIFRYDQPYRFAKLLTRYNRMLIQITPYNSNPTMSTFNLQGLDGVIDQVGNACHWTQSGVELEYIPSKNGLISISRTMLRRAQEKLQQRGFYHGELDGIFGPSMRMAFETFQRIHGLEITGVPDGRTLNTL